MGRRRRRDDPRARIPGRPGPLTTHRRVCTPKGGPQCSYSLPARLFLSLSLGPGRRLRIRHRCRRRLVRTARAARASSRSCAKDGAAGACDLHRQPTDRSASPPRRTAAACRPRSRASSRPAPTAAPTRRSRSRSAIAPVAENIVVSATRTEAPSGQVAAAVTVFDAAEIERKQQPLLADLLRDAPGTTVVRTGAPGHGDVALRPRRREQLHEGAARRHSAERAGRRVQPEQRHDGKPRSRRVRARRPTPRSTDPTP